MDSIEPQPGSPNISHANGQPAPDASSTHSGADSTAMQQKGEAPLLPESQPELEEIIRGSPFLDLSSPMTRWEWFKLFAMIPAVLIRIALTVVCMPFVWLVVRLVTLGINTNDPIVGWRRAIIRPFLRFWARILLHIGFNFWPRLIGYEHFRKAEEVQAMIVFNHVSYTDGIVLGAYFLPCGVAKASVADIPFFGVFTKACSFLFISRKGTADAAKSVEALKGRTTEIIQERAADPRYPLLALAPEGTCKHPNCLLTFSTGAFVGGRPVVPILLHYRARHFNLGWGRVASNLWHFARVQTQFTNHLTVEVLPPYMPSPKEKKDPRLYAENVRAVMARGLGADLSEHGLREQQALRRAGVCVDMMGRQVISKGGTAGKAAEGGVRAAEKGERVSVWS